MSEPYGPPGKGHPLLRAVIYLVALLAVGVLLAIAAEVVLATHDLPLATSAADAFLMDTNLMLGAAVVASLLMLLVTTLFLRLWDHCPWGQLFNRWPGDAPPDRSPRSGVEIMLGCAIATGMLLLLLAISHAAGWFVIDGWAPTAQRGMGDILGLIGIYIFVFLVQGGAEEIVFRGYLFRNLGLWRGSGAAMLGGALLFALAHGVNPGTGVLPITNTLLIGLMLALIRIRFSLWTAVGFHAAWNLVLALVAVPVSGLAPEGLLASRLRGPALWSGGEYGCEASLLTTILVLLVCIGLGLDRGLRARLRAAAHDPA